MTAKEVMTRAGEFIAARKVELAGLGVTAVTVASASATVDLNGTIGPILDSTVELIPSLINLVVGLVPAVIAIAVIGLIVGIFEGIVGKFKI